MKDPPPVQSLIMSVNFLIELVARSLSPSSFALLRPSHRVIPARAQAPWMVSRVVLPMPRVGVLTTRSKETGSDGFAMTRR